MTSKLDKYTIAEIHTIILRSSSKKQANNELGIDDNLLDRHLSKFTYEDVPLTYNKMKTLRVDEAELFWGEKYNQPMIAPNIKISDYTVSDIHAAILNSTYLKDAASQLEINHKTFANHLAKFKYKEKSLTYSVMKDMTVDNAKTIWGDAYDQPMSTPHANKKVKAKLSNFTIAEIHKVILQSKSKTQATKELEVSRDFLDRNLSKFTYKDVPLNYDKMKNIKVDEAELFWGEKYNQPMIAPNIKISDYTVSKIHTAILNSNSASEAAQKLGVDHKTFFAHLAKFKYNEESLSYSLMKDITVDKAKTVWGDAYDQPMFSRKIKLEDYTVSYIHTAILNSESANDAAKKLGVRRIPFETHLGKFTHGDTPFTFDVMKRLTLEDAQLLWGDSYNQPMTSTKRGISDFTIANIHKIIMNSSSLNDAAQKVGISSTTLKRYLANIIYDNKQITYEAMKELSVENAELAWGENYHRPMTISKSHVSDYTFAHIHEIILISHSLDEAASKLNSSSHTLSKYLGNFIFKNEPLTFDVMKSISIDEAKAAWSDNYYQSISAVKIELGNYTVAYIHKTILESETPRGAANKLSVSDRTLKAHLGKFIYNNNPLSFDEMKKLSIEDGINLWGESYYQPMTPPKINISDYTVAYIHKIILNSNSLHQAATKLGVGEGTLASYLGKFILNDAPLTFELMKNLSVETAESFWGDSYHQAMTAPQIQIGNYTTAHIHRIILDSSTACEAAYKLGVRDGTLNVHLGKFLYSNSPLTFQTMKNLHIEDAIKLWGESYYQPMTPPDIDVSSYTLAYIHHAILQSSTLTNAATNLGTFSRMLAKHLKKLNYHNVPLTYEILKKLSADDAYLIWGEDYHRPMNAQNKNQINAQSSTDSQMGHYVEPACNNIQMVFDTLRLTDVNDGEDIELFKGILIKMFEDLLSSGLAINDILAQLSSNDLEVSLLQKLKDIDHQHQSELNKNNMETDDFSTYLSVMINSFSNQLNHLSANDNDFLSNNISVLTVSMFNNQFNRDVRLPNGIISMSERLDLPDSPPDIESGLSASNESAPPHKKQKNL